jgi:hypothetical protein
MVSSVASNATRLFNFVEFLSQPVTVTAFPTKPLNWDKEARHNGDNLRLLVKIIGFFNLMRPTFASK